MPKEMWPLAEAKKILEAQKNEGDKTIVFETGYGPSGLPHIGTFAEVTRTRFVIEALLYLAPEKKVELIAFSDDMDGLRKLPGNIPNHDLLRPHLGKPLCDIPDPYGECGSYSEYMNNKLRGFLDSFSIEYAFKSAAETYRGGEFDPALDLIFDRYEKVKSIFVKSISEEKRRDWSPFFIKCEKCGKITTTRTLNYDPQKRAIRYVCDADTDEYQSCGHEGWADYRGGASKVGWKVDWGMRWHAFDVAYEMHGEDLTDSAKVSAKISRLLGGKAPVNFKYELFLDENNQKISKKIGNGISMEQWISYAPLAALLHFLLGNPNKPRRMGLPILPQIVDEFFQTLRGSKPDTPESPLWYIAKFPKAIVPSKPTKLTYSLLCNVCESLSINKESILFEYAKKYDPGVEDDAEFYQKLCGHVIRYVADYKSRQQTERIVPDASMEPLLDELIAGLSGMDEDSEAFQGDSLQTFIFGIAKAHAVEPAKWFRFLYNLMLNQNMGPKLGPLISLVGKRKSLEMLDKSKLC